MTPRWLYVNAIVSRIHNTNAPSEAFALCPCRQRVEAFPKQGVEQGFSRRKAAIQRAEPSAGSACDITQGCVGYRGKVVIYDEMFEGDPFWTDG